MEEANRTRPAYLQLLKRPLPGHLKKVQLHLLAFNQAAVATVLGYCLSRLKKSFGVHTQSVRCWPRKEGIKKYLGAEQVT